MVDRVLERGLDRGVLGSSRVGEHLGRLRVARGVDYGGSRDLLVVLRPVLQ